MKTLKLILIIITIITCVQLSSQELYSSAGDYYESTGMSLTFSLGETVIETYESSNLVITQGFNQTQLNVTGIKDLDKIAEEISIYPNPVSENLIIETETEYRNYKYSIRNIKGALIKQGVFSGLETKINFCELNEAVYILLSI